MTLSDEERARALEALPEWRYEPAERAIRRGYSFADFGEAFAFMARAALAAEKADHHPDWSNSWNKVSVALSTHSAGGVTAKDIDLAKAMDAFAARLP
ncbi:MAG TPA: 4a-hydroxytetrahydrobiopterin dehydratase [Allosphingosinicella sp.]|jgi:4a-hydroxytetrahydrobiopterin dehydratase|nr:4a-hydroxytetrahydrobiopterin dehydratase [Allosphingosinicella sp.]